jgi:hypothetical protein
MKNYDLVVIGGGPGGAGALRWHLLELGLYIDQGFAQIRRAYQQEKTCGRLRYLGSRFYV